MFRVGDDGRTDEAMTKQATLNNHGLFECTDARFNANIKRTKRELAKAVAVNFKDFFSDLGREYTTIKHWMQFSKEQLAVVLGEVQP